jgi:hypothetical protein
VFSFLAPAFERYVVAATRQAIPHISDPAVVDEAEAFLRQEAAHAKAHRVHAKALIAQFPGLESTMADANAAFDRLLDQEDLEFHLAYVADLEATFTPLFKMVFDNRGPLFEGGDDRVGTLFLWHFVEEIEHRSSALRIHHAVTPDRWYRIRRSRQVFKHVGRVWEGVLRGFDAHVPLEVRQVPTSVLGGNEMHLAEIRARVPYLARRHPDGPTPMLGHVPGRDLRSMAWHLAQSQLPWHNPEHEPLPAWADEWFAAFEAGEDVTTYAGARL